MPPLSKHIDKLVVMRLDGGIYESTVDVLYTMYDKLSVGGYVIMDDWDKNSVKKILPILQLLISLLYMELKLRLLQLMDWPFTGKRLKRLITSIGGMRRSSSSQVTRRSRLYNYINMIMHPFIKSKYKINT